MIQIPGFRTVLRGYDPTEVDRAIGDLIKARDQARSEAADHALARAAQEPVIAQLTEQANGYRTRLEKLEASKDETPSVSDIGARIGRMLTLAEDEANEVRNQASAEAERIVALARTEADQVTGNAERYARDVVSKADTEAARILEAARRQSDEIVDYADREAVSRREEAEGIYEAHRARAAAATEEFDRNLAARQEAAEAEFAAQAAGHEQTLASLRTEHEDLRAVIDQLAEHGRAEAASAASALRQEAAEHLAAAHDQARQVREEAEKRAQETLARRDAVIAQLTAVRHLLAGLDLGASPVDAAESGDGPTALASVLAAGEVVDADAVQPGMNEENESETDARDAAGADNEGMAKSGQR